MKLTQKKLDERYKRLSRKSHFSIFRIKENIKSPYAGINDYKEVLKLKRITL